MQHDAPSPRRAPVTAAPTTMSGAKPLLTTEDRFRQKQQLSARPPNAATKRKTPPPSSSVGPKRPRTHTKDADADVALPSVAPDWRGDEMTSTQPWGSTQAPFANRPTSRPPPPPSAVPRRSADPLSLAHRKWGLHPEIVKGFRECGVDEMYPWQSECLSLPGVLEGTKNVVYTAPTSAGKSLVADILMVRKVVGGLAGLGLGERKKAIVVVPYVSIVQEKTRFLNKCLGSVRVEMPRMQETQPQAWRNLNIVGFHSGARNRMRWKDIDIVVCTIERANTLVNAAVEDRTINELGVAVFDELHMVGDEHRGLILELLAAKLLCLELPVQIVGMSATLSNITVLGKWLKAALYECNFRPVPLDEYLVYDGAVYSNSHELHANIPPSDHKSRKETVTNSIVALTHSAISEGHGVLVFCESRRRCEDLALLVLGFIPRIRDEELIEKRINVVGDLATTPTGMDPVLAKSVPAGVAFHHAGLTTEERDIVTAAYNDGAVKAIFCTATMAAGVNLPARRVIISPRMGRDFVSAAMLRQMRGRAGRKGRDTRGESYVCCRREDLPTIEKLLNESLPSVSSCLISSENTSSGLSRALLEIISTRLATSLDSIEEYFNSTLLQHTHHTLSDLPTLLKDCLETLHASTLLQDPTADGEWSATRTGHATVVAGFTPSDGLFMSTELTRALAHFNLETDMHIVYHFTPIHASTSSVSIDWKLLRDELERLDEPSLRAATFCGVNPAFIHKLASGGLFRDAGGAKERVYRRFYTSLMLRQLINETPIHHVARHFAVPRGFVQSLATTCRGFATTSAAYCKAMGWTGLAVLLEHYSWRLDLGVKDDLVDLARLPFVKSRTARVFYEAGLRTMENVADAKVEVLVNVLAKAMPGANRGRVREKCEERAKIVAAAARRILDRRRQEELDELE
ncbi:P-loop containing nucleoside triphosphate hydrolase protein [Tricharina praecox]|uniref:P-loop containing nucleoside triphosphate hydrolase protein n=1 Tax=Tricharina praecox TaxID=43433 RepID=UPI00221F75DF|nr:P-loop containing nucleoside triphosphate hydrolase protein [Tricharina praecox]KAI5852311.1 P-loop containing nucleoside triphosphate hydrolase protein [Tricharina praecox]